MINQYSGDAGNVIQANEIHSVYYQGKQYRPPKELPGEPALFVNREEPLEQLDAALAADLSNRRARYVVISGPAGSGKSALAVRWLSGVAPRFADGQVYFNFQDHDGDVGLTGVARHCLRALGVESENVPVQRGGVLSMLRSVTDGRRLVFLFDNVPAHHELWELGLSSPEILIVITSQDSTVPPGVGHSISIGRLAEQYASRMLMTSSDDQRVGNEPAAAERIVALCGAMPLALRIVAGQLAQRPKWTLKRVVDVLAGASGRIDQLTYQGDRIMRRTLEFAYGQLSDSQAWLYRMLGLIPGRTFSADAVAALSELTRDEAEDVLEELRAVNLLECDDQDHYRFHELVRLHAKEFDVDGADDAVLRLAEWYRELGAFADRAILGPVRLRVGGDEELLAGRENPFDRNSGLEWLERERLNLLAVVREAEQRGWDGVVISLCDSPLWALHNQHKHYPDTVEALCCAVAAARHRADPVAQARMRTLLARLHMECQEFTEAHEQAVRASRIAEQAGHRPVLASAIEFQARIFLEQDSFAEAIELFERAHAINAELASPRGMAIQEYLLGRAHIGLDHPEDGLRLLHTALRRLAEYPDDRRIPAQIRVQLGAAQQRMGQHREAIEVLRTALAEIADRGASFDRAKPLELLADSCVAIGELETASEHRAEAARIRQRVDPDVAQSGTE